MTQHDPSARGPVPRHSAQARASHGEWAHRPSEVPDPQSVPADWSPSGMTHAGTPGAGYADYPADAWTGAGQPAAWNGGSIPDRVPAAWSTPEPATEQWTEPHPPAWNNAAAEQPSSTWNAAPEAAPAWGAVVPRPHAHPPATPAVWEPTAAPAAGRPPAVPGSASGARTPKKSKLIFAGALVAAALAGGGAGAGIMAAVGGESAATAPAGQPPNGPAPTAPPTKAS
ncbi:hypothetical protein FHR83_006892 [Actinoplanes campanulatus]|uniref:Uncharacterized protein n=1 Tax=Actinoplanes campanulatus TaxID=113559 RepID=A0A7W5AN70_9ACTN|nr:hypothetical protein [Actinoplanes campanulatus]MBB3099186.1 hypothetical protein [Actinoplanes campanulatus]GGN41126.1 hypothetical protein GCM10010109_70990 [Actinoplanes campanulatus]GID40504.1 hypothetical protein Aca09nite_70100 [Actinoplanes campanulatus]